MNIFKKIIFAVSGLLCLVFVLSTYSSKVILHHKYGLPHMFEANEKCRCDQLTLPQTNTTPADDDSPFHNSAEGNLEIENYEAEILSTNLLWVKELDSAAYNIPTVKEIQLKRLSQIHKICKKGMPRFGSQYLGHYQYLSFKNVTWSLIPKTGSTNILRIICILVGPKCTNRTGYFDPHSYIPRFMKAVKDLSPYSSNKQNWNTSNFIYVFVRDPWHRLVSIYIEKVLFSDSYKLICARNGNRKFDALLIELMASNETMTFKQFIEYCVIEHYIIGGLNGMEPHYKPQSISGAFCDIGYNFIGKTETYDDDIKVVLGQYDVSDVSALLTEAAKFRRPNEKSHLTSTSYLDRWKSVDNEMIDILHKIYINDITLFNYASYPY